MSVRGYKPDHRFKPETLQLLAHVEAVLDEYENYLPLTVRQIFYRLIGKGVIGKSDAAYDSLVGHIANARRAELIPFESITDADVEGLAVPRTDVEIRQGDFWTLTEKRAGNHRRHRAEGQPYRIIVWTEAAGTKPQLQRALGDLPCTVHSGGGQTSLTVVKALADASRAENKPTVMLHVGDNDPNGTVIYQSLAEDAQMFAAQDRVRAARRASEEPTTEQVTEWLGLFQPVRLALTIDQIIDHNVIEQLLHIPSDTLRMRGERTKRLRWQAEQIAAGGSGDTAQLEALPPDVLAQIVIDAVMEFADEKVLEQRREGEQADAEALVTKVREIRNGL
jgi:hypothetical protein